MAVMTVVTITEAKANLSKLLAMVERGEEVAIKRGAKVIATINPAKPKGRAIKLGTMEGQGWMADDFDVWPEEEARALGIID